MFDNFNIKINNYTYIDKIIPIIEPVSISWSYDKNRIVVLDEEKFDDIYEIDQSAFMFKLSDNNIGWGTTSFSGDIIDGVRTSTVTEYVIPNGTLEVGNTYYGQINVKNKQGYWSGWKTFSIKYNSIPVISSLYITPTEPTINNDLKLNYYPQSGYSAIIKWYKNYKYMPQFDQYSEIPNEYLSYGEFWYVTLALTDGYNYSDVYSSNTVAISSEITSASGFEILPLYPNENDLLKAYYDYNYSTDNEVLVRQDIIKWYVNDILVKTSYDNLYARLDVSPGDEVYYTVTAFDGTNTGATQSSEKKIIEADKVKFISLSLDSNILSSYSGGISDKPLYVVDNITPFVSWITSESGHNKAQKIMVKIGSNPYAEDIYSEEVYVSDNMGSFSIPPSILDKGEDYYLSVSIYESYSKSYVSESLDRFRIKGSYWEEGVNNSTGWAVEVQLKYPFELNASFNESKFQVLRLSDGVKYIELRIYNNKIGIYSDGLYLSDQITSSDVSQSFDSIIISGQGDDAYVYFNGIEVIDGTGKMSQTTSSRNMILGVQSYSGNSNFPVSYKEINYYLDGMYSPVDDPYDLNYYYKDMFHIRDEEIIGISISKDIVNDNVVDRIFFATRPFFDESSSSVFEIKSGNIFSTGASPYSSSSIRDIAISGNSNNLAVATSEGFISMNSYPILKWDYDNTFDDKFDWINDFKFELVSNTDEVSAYYDDGLIILTSSTNKKLY